MMLDSPVPKSGAGGFPSQADESFNRLALQHFVLDNSNEVELPITVFKPQSTRD